MAIFTTLYFLLLNAPWILSFCWMSYADFIVLIIILLNNIRTKTSTIESKQGKLQQEESPKLIKRIFWPNLLKLSQIWDLDDPLPFSWSALFQQKIVFFISWVGHSQTKKCGMTLRRVTFSRKALARITIRRMTIRWMTIRSMTIRSMTISTMVLRGMML